MIAASALPDQRSSDSSSDTAEILRGDLTRETSPDEPSKNRKIRLLAMHHARGVTHPQRLEWGQKKT